MFSCTIRCASVVMLGAVLVGCGGSDDKPGSSGNGGSSGEGSDNAAGASDTAGSAAMTNEGGSQSDGGAPSGGAGQDGNGAASSGGDASGGQPPTSAGDPPSLEGDGISWSWDGKTYTANKNPHNGFYPAVEAVSISAADTTDSVPPNQFTLHLMPDKVGTFQCKDYVTALDSSFAIVWQTFDTTMNPPNPGFTYSPDLPCEFTITRADAGDKAGDVFEGTFRATLHFALKTPDYGPADRSVVGTMRLTKQ
jgi:hypothetical protein